MSGSGVKRVYVVTAMVTGAFVGVLLGLLIVVLQQAVVPPNVFTLAVGQSEGDTTFVGIRGESLWLEKGTGRPFTSYSPAFAVPARAGVHIALSGEVYAVVSSNSFADVLRLKRVTPHA